MEDNEVKRYFKKINTTFSGVNKQDDFARMFLNLIKSGNTTLYQKERRERRIFDDSWMDSVEGAIPVIDKLTRNPREILKKVNMVVPVERAKHIDQDTVKHLAQNTHLIKDIDADGNVIPSKVLTYYNESDLGTYENRFLRSFVDKLYSFIEKRYDLIVQKMHTEYVNYLNIKSEVEWEESTVEFDITMRMNEIIKKDEIDMKNQELFDRIIHIRKAITMFKMSDFMEEMKKFSPVTPPIMKTNLIMKNPDFRQCYYLWVLMDQADRIGYDIDVFERDVDFDEDYLDGIENLLMVLYSTVANNQNDEFIIAQNNPYEYRKVKRPRIKKNDQNDQYVKPGYYEFEDNTLNQYYLDQVRSANLNRFKSLEEAGIPMTESIDIVFQQMNQITDAVYEDFIKHSFRPEEAKDIEEKIKLQEQILDVYRQIEKIKREDMRQLSTNKAIALLNLRNYQDELKAEKKFEEDEKKRAEEEDKMTENADKRAKAEDEAEKKRQLERARKILEDAQKEREQKEGKDDSE